MPEKNTVIFTQNYYIFPYILPDCRQHQLYSSNNKVFLENYCIPRIGKYLVSGFTRNKEAIYVNGVRVFVLAEYDRFKAGVPKKQVRLSYLEKM